MSTSLVAKFQIRLIQFMLFNSLEFLVFFIITTSLFFLLKHQYRWLLLLLASCYFYMVFKPIYILILAFTIVIDYFAGIAIEKQEKQHNKKLLLILSLVANLGILIVFKYWNFLAENLNFFIGTEKNENLIPFLNILLPIGLFKKIFIADRLGSYVDSYYNNLDYLSFIPSVSAAIFYSLQIYCDFSGYSSIAIGTAKCMGFNLMKNFNTPYQAASITDFWRRWHISLSTWFRDYVYIPLGGNKGTKSTTIRNISIVFLLSGVWHGANWTFIVWGAIHACLLILEQLFISKKINTIQPTIWRKLLVFSLVTLAWIFFRSKDFNQAFQVLKNIFSFQFNLEINQISAFISPLNMLLCWICIPLLFLIDNIKFSTYRKHLLAFLVAGTLLIITLGKSNEAAFIYFQF